MLPEMNVSEGSCGVSDQLFEGIQVFQTHSCFLLHYRQLIEKRVTARIPVTNPLVEDF